MVPMDEFGGWHECAHAAANLEAEAVRCRENAIPWMHTEKGMILLRIASEFEHLAAAAKRGSANEGGHEQAFHRSAAA